LNWSGDWLNGQDGKGKGASGPFFIDPFGAKAGGPHGQLFADVLHIAKS
jgi:hypothetical protein